MNRAQASAGQPLYLVVGIRSNFAELLADGLATARRHGFDPRIVDVVELVEGWKPYPNDWAALGLADDVLRIADREAFSALVASPGFHRAVVLFLYLPDRHLRPLWRQMAAAGARVGVIVAGPVPTESSLPRGRSPRAVAARAWLRLKRRFKPRPDYWITAGSVCRSLYASYFRSLDGVVEIHAHSLDHERLRRAGPAAAESTGVVFLDQGWFSKPRPDFLDPSRYPPMDETAYARGVRGLLEHLRSAGQRVVVCAHPKASLAHTRSLFDGFDVRQGNTAGLVGGAHLVIAHSTTAIGHAVMHRVPVLLFDSAALRTSIVAPLLAGYRRELGLATVALDEPASYDRSVAAAVVDDAAYDRYLDRYVKQADSPDAGLWEIAFGGLRRAFDGPAPAAAHRSRQA